MDPVVEDPCRGVLANSNRRVSLEAVLARRRRIGAKGARPLAVGVAQSLMGKVDATPQAKNAAGKRKLASEFRVACMNVQGPHDDWLVITSRL